MTTQRKYSLRKFKVGVASVLVGIGIATTGVAVAHASDESATSTKIEVTNPEIKQAEAEAKTAEAKVVELETKVAEKTTVANTATEKAKTEAAEAATANKAKIDAEAAKTAATDALNEATQKATQAATALTDAIAKEEAARKEAAETKKAIETALTKFETDAEEAINKDSRIQPDNKAKAIEKAKETIGKTALLKAIEDGELTLDEVAKELNNQAETAKADEAKNPQSNDFTAEAAQSGNKTDIPAELKTKIDKAEKAEAARPASEKAQEKADALEEEIEDLTAVAEKDKAEAERKADLLEKQETVLTKAKEALKLASDNKVNSDIISSLEKVVKEIEVTRDSAKADLDKSYEPLQAYEEEINKLTDEYNTALEAVKVAKEKEASEPAKPVETTPVLPKEKTEVEKATEVKQEADAKVVELTKKLEEATTTLTEAIKKAEKEANDSTTAEQEKITAEQAKTSAEAELATAIEEAKKAKDKVEELKNEETTNLEAIKKALDKLEKAAIAKINEKTDIKNKEKAIEEAKHAIGKEDILNAIEKGIISATEVAKVLENADKTKDDAPVPVTETKKLADEDIKKLDAVKKADASRTELQKLQDKADDLADEIDDLSEIAEKDKADAEKKAATLDKQEITLTKAKEALKAAIDNGSSKTIVDSLTKIVKSIEKVRDTAKVDFDKSNEPLQAYSEAINQLTDEYNEYTEVIKVLSAAPTTEGPVEYTKSLGTNGEEAAPTADAPVEYTKPLGTNGEEAAPTADAPVEYTKPLGTNGEEAAPTADAPIEYTNPLGTNSTEATPVVESKPEAPSVETPTKPTESSPAKPVTDNSEKIAVLSRTLADGVKVSVEYNSSKIQAKDFIANDVTGDKAKEIETLVKKLNPNLTVVRTLELHFTGQNGKEVKTTGDRTVTFAVANGEDQELKVYHVNGATLDEVPSSYKDGNITFNTSHFSNFVVTKLINTAAVNEVTKLDSATVKAEITKLKEQLKTADSTTAEKLETLISDNEALLEDLNVLEANLPAVNEVPEYTGPVATNGQEAPTLDVPEYDLSKLPEIQGASAPTFGQNPKVKVDTKEDVKSEKSLPNTGTNTTSTAAFGLGLITLIGLAIRRKINN
ncbi:SIALI-17 repeat-containing surface protein [uncultured Gemella sp.]|uniref:SIALI-17 repeat-containing surface protein n=1 Tax=uncultured Gemella sp. TaxID=254352 RepID=UPI0028D66685|nr:SIALI-17 repeat-containing surface protein [uncultured Gemella sp.]